jgi:hypothetical protein
MDDFNDIVDDNDCYIGDKKISQYQRPILKVKDQVNDKKTKECDHWDQSGV